MIHAIDSGNLPRLRQFCGKVRGPFACRIQALADGYGTGFAFARFWIQQTRQGSVCAAISALDNAFTLCALPESDWDELSSFWRLSGGSSLMAEKQTLARLDLPLPEEVLLRWNGPIPSSLPKGYEISQTPSLMQLHSLLVLCEGPGFHVPPLETFYPDLSHRIRHKTARALGVLNPDGSLAACAVACAQTQWAAVISAVASHPQSRGLGLACAAVSSLTNSLPHPVYVTCLPALVPFYKRLGAEVVSP